MGTLATIIASVVTSVLTVLAALAGLALLGGRRAFAAMAAPAAPGAGLAVAGPTPAAPAHGPSTHFSVQRARLDFPDHRALVGQPCRVRFAWLLFNGAHSYITFRTRIRAQPVEGEPHQELNDPATSAPRAASYQQRIVGGIDGELTWNRPGVYEVQARVKASIEGTPFTYAFEVKRRVRVVEAKEA